MTELFISTFFKKVSRATFWGFISENAPHIACLDIDLKCPVPMAREYAERLSREVSVDAIMPTGGTSVVRFPFRIASIKACSKTYFIFIMTPALSDDVRYASFMLLHEAKMTGRHQRPDGTTLTDDDLFSSEIAQVAIRYGNDRFETVLPNAFGLPNGDGKEEDDDVLDIEIVWDETAA